MDVLAPEERLARDEARERTRGMDLPRGSFAYAVAKYALCKGCGGPRSWERRKLCEGCDPVFAAIQTRETEEKEEKAAMNQNADIENTEETNEATETKADNKPPKPAKAAPAPKPVKYEAEAYPTLDPLKVRLIGIDTEHTSMKEHPLYDPRVLLPINEGLVANIMAHGVKVPVMLRPDGPYLDVIDGRQRVRALREANRRLVEQGARPFKLPYHVEKGMNDVRAMQLMVLTNEQRVQDNGLNKAQKARALLDAGMTEAEVALEFGVSKQSVDIWMRVLACDETVLKALEDGLLKMSGARAIAGESRERQREIVAELRAKAAAKPARSADSELDGDNEDSDDVSERTGSGKPEGASAKDVKKTRDKDDDGEESEAPSRLLLKRLERNLADPDSDIHKACEIEGHDAFLFAIQWVLQMKGGENHAVKPRSLKGLSAAVNWINNKYEKDEPKSGQKKGKK